jgi:hypothetical protein
MMMLLLLWPAAAASEMLCSDGHQFPPLPLPASYACTPPRDSGADPCCPARVLRRQEHASSSDLLIGAALLRVGAAPELSESEVDGMRIGEGLVSREGHLMRL